MCRGAARCALAIQIGYTAYLKNGGLMACRGVARYALTASIAALIA